MDLKYRKRQITAYHELIMNFSIRHKLGNQEKFYYMGVGFVTSSYAISKMFCWNSYIDRYTSMKPIDFKASVIGSPTTPNAS